MNILIATNSAYMHPTSVMLYSLCKQHPEKCIDLYVAYHDLTANDFETMQRIFNHFKNKSIHPIDVGGVFAEQIRNVDQFSYESYYRILALKLLPESIDRILYLDADILIHGNLSQMYQTPIDASCPFWACLDGSAYRDNAFDIAKKRAEIPLTSTYFNSGVLLFNLNYIRERRSIGYIIDAFIREQDHYRYHDQDILNHMYYDKVDFLPWQLYNLPPAYYFLDTHALSKGEIRYATYQKIFNRQESDSRFLNITEQICENAKIIHYLWILKPWKYSRDNVPTDLIPFFKLWYADEDELRMLENQQ